MSHIAFHSKEHETVYVHGSERAHMGIVITDMAAAIFPRGVGDEHPFINLVPQAERERWSWTLRGPQAEGWVKIYLSSYSDYQLEFNGTRHESKETVLNTILAMDSDIMSFMVKVDGTCESHGWFPDRDHNHFAAIMRQGLDRHILRSNRGWDAVIDMFEADLNEPIVMSYSVTNGFPNDEICGVMEKDVDEWYETHSQAQQWDASMAALRKLPYLEISGQTLNEQWFLDASTLWDAMESPEWKGEVDGTI